jgi:hypothetical protein
LENHYLGRKYIAGYCELDATPVVEPHAPTVNTKDTKDTKDTKPGGSSYRAGGTALCAVERGDDLDTQTPVALGVLVCPDHRFTRDAGPGPASPPARVSPVRPPDLLSLVIL